jgi:hypothetical protein
MTDDHRSNEWFLPQNLYSNILSTYDEKIVVLYVINENMTNEKF